MTAFMSPRAAEPPRLPGSYKSFESRSTDWMADAACRHPSVDVRLFHSDSLARIAEAKAICVEFCPVRERCLDYAIVRDEPDGVWGGLTPEARAVVKAARAGVVS